jgi:hypothetical protein
LKEELAKVQALMALLPQPPDTHPAVLKALVDEVLAYLIHEAEAVLEARWPAPPLTEDTAALFEAERRWA